VTMLARRRSNVRSDLSRTVQDSQLARDCAQLGEALDILGPANEAKRPLSARKPCPNTRPVECGQSRKDVVSQADRRSQWVPTPGESVVVQQSHEQTPVALHLGHDLVGDAIFGPAHPEAPVRVLVAQCLADQCVKPALRNLAA